MSEAGRKYRESRAGVNPEAQPLARDLYSKLRAATKVGRIGGEVAKQGALDLVGGTANFLGSVLSYPKAFAIHKIMGTTTEPEFKPTASLEQFKEILSPTPGDRPYEEMKPIPPWLADIATDIPMASALNVAGKRALLPAGRALANLEVGGRRVRAIPGVKGTLEFFKPGASLPNKYRDDFYRILAEAEGKTDWRAFLRRRALEGGQDLPVEAQNRIAHAIETRTVGALDDDLQGWAKRIIQENRNMIADRLKADMARAELAGDDLEYVARILTPEGRKGVQVPAAGGGTRPLSPYGEAFDLGPPSLGTSLGKRRTEAGRKLTTQELSGGRQMFLPSIEGTLAKGAQNDRAVMHGRIIRDLDRRFGRPLQAGEKPIGSIAGVPQGFDASMKQRLMSRSLPPELHEVVAKLNQTFQPEEWGKTSEFVRQMNDQFRKWALFSPGFISRNMQNNVIQSAMFGNRDPRNWAWAQGLREKVRTGARLEPEEMAELKAMIENGVLSRGYIARETGAGSKYDAAFKFMRRANTYAEDVSRMAFYRYSINKGLTPYQAGQEVNKVLFNYSPTFQSRGFKAARRHVMPFINWQSNIPQLAARTLIERPGSLGMVGSIRAKLNDANATPEAYEALPNYMKEEMATAIAKDTWLMPQGFGTSDIGGQAAALAKDIEAARGVGKNVLKGGRQEFPEYKEMLRQPSAVAGQLASMSYPQWSVLYSAVSGFDPFTGQKIMDWRKYLAGKVPIARIPVLAYEIYTKKPGWQGRVVSFLAGIKTYEKPTGK